MSDWPLRHATTEMAKATGNLAAAYQRALAERDELRRAASFAAAHREVFKATLSRLRNLPGLPEESIQDVNALDNFYQDALRWAERASGPASAQKDVTDGR